MGDYNKGVLRNNVSGVVVEGSDIILVGCDQENQMARIFHKILWQWKTIKTNGWENLKWMVTKGLETMKLI